MTEFFGEAFTNLTFESEEATVSHSPASPCPGQISWSVKLSTASVTLSPSPLVLTFSLRQWRTIRRMAMMTTPPEMTATRVSSSVVSSVTSVNISVSVWASVDSNVDMHWILCL